MRKLTDRKNKLIGIVGQYYLLYDICLIVQVYFETVYMRFLLPNMQEFPINQFLFVEIRCRFE